MTPAVQPEHARSVRLDLTFELRGAAPGKRSGQDTSSAAAASRGGVGPSVHPSQPGGGGGGWGGPLSPWEGLCCSPGELCQCQATLYQLGVSLTMGSSCVRPVWSYGNAFAAGGHPPANHSDVAREQREFFRLCALVVVLGVMNNKSYITYLHLIGPPRLPNM